MTETVKTKINVECKPWQTPNFILTVGVETSISIRDAPYELVQAMLWQFEADVWNKHNEATAPTET